jgi:hypothetical protein
VEGDPLWQVHCSLDVQHVRGGLTNRREAVLTVALGLAFFAVPLPAGAQLETAGRPRLDTTEDAVTTLGSR